MKCVLKNVPAIRSKLSSVYHARNSFYTHLNERNKDKMIEDLNMIDKNTAELRAMIVSAPISKKAHEPSPLGGMMKAKMATFRENGLSFDWLKSLREKPRTAKECGLMPVMKIQGLAHLEVITRIPPKNNNGREYATWAPGPTYETAIKCIPTLEASERLRETRLELARKMREAKKK